MVYTTTDICCILNALLWYKGNDDRFLSPSLLVHVSIRDRNFDLLKDYFVSDIGTPYNLLSIVSTYIYIRSFFSFFSFFLLFIFERVALLFTCTNNVRIPYESTYEFIMYEKIVFLFYKKVLSAVRETKHDRWVFRYLVRCYGRSIKLNSW